MNDENIKDIVKIRYERSLELLEEAKRLYKDGSYKSANNRAFYSAEKAIKAALITRGKDSEKHAGLIKTFNMEFIYNPSEYFDREDLGRIQSMERIRTASDYDDFYIASKTECEEQIVKAEAIFNKVKYYLEAIDMV